MRQLPFKLKQEVLCVFNFLLTQSSVSLLLSRLSLCLSLLLLILFVIIPSAGIRSTLERRWPFATMIFLLWRTTTVLWPSRFSPGLIATYSSTLTLRPLNRYDRYLCAAAETEVLFGLIHALQWQK